MHFVEIAYKDTCVISVKGSLVHKEDTDKLQEKISQILDRDIYQIVIDLKNIDMITSLGIGGLIRGLRTAREKKGELKLSGVSASVRKVLDITKLNEIIDMYDTHDDAVKSFSEIVD